MSFIFPRSHLAGLTLSTAGSSATFGIAAGQCTDDANTVIMNAASAFTKTTATWAEGTGLGALLDAGSILASKWYHAFAMRRPDTLGVDFGISTSLTPTLPSAYTTSRRIGSMKTDGPANWVKFLQIGDDFFWPSPFNDVVGSAVAANTPTSFALTSVPPGLKFKVRFNTSVQNSANTLRVRIYDPDLGDSNNVTNINLGGAFTGVSTAAAYNALQCYCDITQHVRVNSPDTVSALYVWVTGFADRRGKDV